MHAAAPAAVQAGACNAFPGAYWLGASYTDASVTVPACGPLPLAGGSTAPVYAYPGATYIPGYQCVELSERYLYYRFGAVMHISTNGDQVVDHYAAAYPSLFQVINNGTPGQAPVQGDVLSLSEYSTFNYPGGGHTAVVEASQVDGNGNGQLTIVEQNAVQSGTESIPVYGWSVHYNGFPYAKWLHHRGATASVARSQRVPDDLDNNGMSDIAIFRPSNGQWWDRGRFGLQYGQYGDVPVPADYNGDGRQDIAVWRPSSGVWYLRTIADIQYGQPRDIPVPGDYNRDGRTDIAVYRPSTGTWWVRGQFRVQYGQPGDIPVPADYNGDGRTDIAVFRPSTGTWWVRGQFAVRYGQQGDIPTPGDYARIGRAQLAVFRPSTSQWWVRGVVSQLGWGSSGDIPIPGDYNGDSRTDFAVYRPGNGTWYVRGIGDAAYGARGDSPLEGRPLP